METFYSVLGVARDADKETIVRAYRDEAKSNHPDVCDRPDATETFKRLTTAKEVLADGAKRAEYDRLGHGAYLAQNDDCCGWSVESSTVIEGGATASSASKAARAYADGGSPTAEPTPKRNPTRGGGGGTATAYYRPGKRMNPGASSPESGGLRARFQAMGPWLLVDVILLLSALGTAWLILSWGSLSASSIVLASLLFVAALATTSVHLSVRAYA